jgi:hypothetical protein
MGGGSLWPPAGSPGVDESLPKLSKPFLQQQLADVIAKTVVG